MRTKRHCRPAKRSSAAVGSCASTAGCSAGTSVNASTAAAASSHSRLSRAVTGGPPSASAADPARARSWARFRAPPASDGAPRPAGRSGSSSRRGRCRPPPGRPASSATTALNSRTGLRGLVTLHEHAAERRPRVARRTDRRRRCAGRPARAAPDRSRRCRFSRPASSRAALDVVEVGRHSSLQGVDGAPRCPCAAARFRRAGRAGCPRRSPSAPAPRRASERGGGASSRSPSRRRRTPSAICAR